MKKILATAVVLALLGWARADVSKFDARIATDVSLASADGIVWRDAAELPLETKVCKETATPYGRIPAELIDKVPDGIRWMAGHSTGHYFLFTTDSDRLGVRWQCRQVTGTDPYIPPQGMYGVDIYVKVQGMWRFVKNGRLGKGPWQETRADLPGSGTREVMVYLPIGRTSSGSVSALPKGSRSSRADTRADAALFIVDPVWNCDEKLIDERTEPFVRRLHPLRPAVPILLCEGPEASGWRMGQNDALKRAYDRLKADPELAGKLHYLPCAGMLPDDGEATHDYIHPNDYGSVQMGRVFGKAIADIL